MTGMALGPSGKWIAGIRPDGSVCEAARVSLEARLATVVHYLPLAAYHAEQDREHVHRLRVATRRAMAVLALYRDYLPCKPASWVKRRLKAARRAAGEARDLDVLAERLLREYRERATKVVDEIASERADVQPQIVKVCAQFRRKDRFVRKSARLIENIRCAAPCHVAQDTNGFRDWAARELATQANEFLSAMPDGHTDLAALHQFRIHGKAFRYTIELLAPALPKEIRETHYRTVEALQEHLGKINDHVTARDRLRQWAAETSDADLQAALCAFADEEVARLTTELGAWRQWWTPERIRDLRQGLSASTATRSSVDPYETQAEDRIPVRSN
jgi:CHAD domain-containing protein